MLPAAGAVATLARVAEATAAERVLTDSACSTPEPSACTPSLMKRIFSSACSPTACRRAPSAAA
jgi:hypothetical protein